MLVHRTETRTKANVVRKRERVTVPQMCENPSCNHRAVAQETKSGVWLCQSCLDVLYDALWGFGA